MKLIADKYRITTRAKDQVSITDKCNLLNTPYLFHNASCITTLQKVKGPKEPREPEPGEPIKDQNNLKKYQNNNLKRD